MARHFMKRGNILKRRERNYCCWAIDQRPKTCLLRGAINCGTTIFLKAPFCTDYPQMIWRYYTRESKENHVQVPPSLLGNFWLSSQYWLFVPWCLKDCMLLEVRCLFSMARKFPTALPAIQDRLRNCSDLSILPLTLVCQALATSYA